MNRFLKEVQITFRRDADTNRPRINELDSCLDREHEPTGEYSTRSRERVRFSRVACEATNPRRRRAVRALGKNILHKKTSLRTRRDGGHHPSSGDAQRDGEPQPVDRGVRTH